MAYTPLFGLNAIWVSEKKRCKMHSDYEYEYNQYLIHVIHTIFLFFYQGKNFPKLIYIHYTIKDNFRNLSQYRSNHSSEPGIFDYKLFISTSTWIPNLRHITLMYSTGLFCLVGSICFLATSQCINVNRGSCQGQKMQKYSCLNYVKLNVELNVELNVLSIKNFLKFFIS